MKNIPPKKSLGQHWLQDDPTLESICDSADIKKDDTVLEIGPGLGTLTKHLLKRAEKVVAVEFDAQLAATLPGKFSNPRLEVVQDDILHFDLTGLPPKFKVVANIPYYLTSNLIRVLCESSNPFSTAVLLIQKEVAERAVARPGQMSLLSVSAQFYCEVALGAKVSKELFIPPPKVDSQVLVLKYRTSPLFPGVDIVRFFRVVKAGFSQKRKTLVNSLSGGLALSKDEARALLEVADIPPGHRAQALSLEDWYALYEAADQR